MFRFLSDLINYPLRRAKLWLKRKLGWLGVPVILPYRGYGNSQKFYVKGRVIEDTGLSQPDVKDSTWHNILAMVKRYASSGIPQATVTLQVGEAPTANNYRQRWLFLSFFLYSTLFKTVARDRLFHGSSAQRPCLPMIAASASKRRARWLFPLLTTPLVSSPTLTIRCSSRILPTCGRS